MPAMAKLTHNRHGNQESVLAKPSRGTAARSDDEAHGLKTGSPKGFGSQKSRGDVAKEHVENTGENSTLSTVLAMVNQEPLLAEETVTSKAHRDDYAREAKNGKKKGLASPEPCRNKIANSILSDKKMDDRVKKGEQLNAEGRGDVLVRLELKRGLGPPPPKRGAVTKAIVGDMKEGVKAGVKKLTDTGRAFCCAPEKFDVDAFVEELPFPTWSEPTATVWPKMEI